MPKIQGFGDYDFSEEELENARFSEGGYDAVYLIGLAAWPEFKAAMIARGEIPFEDLIEAKS